MSILVSNVPFTACQTDSKLINPVDIALSHDSTSIWVSIVASNLVQQYGRKCGKLLSSVTVSTPTGLAVRCKQLYVASQNGTIYTVSRNVTTPTTYVTVSGSLEGLAWLKDLLYVSVSDRGYVGVFRDKVPILSIVNDGLFSFGYRPFGVRALDGRIYITYSNRSTSVGSGYVDVYSPKCGEHGEPINLINRDVLAYPYGLAMLDGILLVGNRGTGRIWSFDKNTGERVEGNESVTKSVNDGLMGMVLKDDLIYFVAANSNGIMGSVGVISTR